MSFLPLLEPPFSAQPRFRPNDEKTLALDNLVSGLGWIATEHVCQAAWPRSRERCVQSRSKPFKPRHLAFGYAKEAVKQETKEIEKLVSLDFVNIDKPETYQDQDVLFLSLKRYRPPKPQSGKTLFFLQGEMCSMYAVDRIEW